MLAQAQVKLSFNPAKGETYSYRFNTESSIKQTVMGQEIPLNTTIEMLTQMNVKEKKKDEVSVDYFYKEIVMEVFNPMMNIKYDSKSGAAGSSEPEKWIAQIFNSLVGKTMNVIFKPDGSVKSISGLQSIMEELQKSMSSDNPALQQVMNSVLQSFNEDAMKQMFEQSFKFYPDKEVKVGDSWNGDISFAIAGLNSDTKNKYTLKSVKNDIALLDMVSVINMKSDGATAMEGEISGEQKGEISLNIKTGMLTNSTATQNMKGKLSVQGTEILMDMATKITVTSK
jgi:hypothetical protein